MSTDTSATDAVLLDGHFESHKMDGCWCPCLRIARSLLAAAERDSGREAALQSLLDDALETQIYGCDHRGIGRPGCRVCDPRVRLGPPYLAAADRTAE